LNAYNWLLLRRCCNDWDELLRKEINQVNRSTLPLLVAAGLEYDEVHPEESDTRVKDWKMMQRKMTVMHSRLQEHVQHFKQECKMQ